MQVLVVSDSHGNVDNMVRAVEWVQPDYAAFGDCQRDLRRGGREFPGLPWRACRGTATGAAMTRRERLRVGRRRILMSYGHTWNVKKLPMAALAYAAKECGAQVLLPRAHPQADGGQRRDADDVEPRRGGGTGSIPPAGVLTIENGKADEDRLAAREKKEQSAMFLHRCHLSASRGLFGHGRTAPSIGANTFSSYLQSPGQQGQAPSTPASGCVLALAKREGFERWWLTRRTPSIPAQGRADAEFARLTMADDLLRMEFVPGNVLTSTRQSHRAGRGGGHHRDRRDAERHPDAGTDHHGAAGDHGGQGQRGGKPVRGAAGDHGPSGA